MAAVRTFLLFLFVPLLAGCENQHTAPVSDGAVGTVTLTLVVEGSSERTIIVDDVAAGTTLESVMKSIDQIPVRVSGSGTTAFVSSIDAWDTEGSKGWTFKVDGEFANQGIGKTILTPPTMVEWSYGEFEM